MLKKTITFNDLDGNPVTEDFYFNLTKAEIAEMELSAKGGLSEQLKRIMKAGDNGEILKAFKEIIVRSVGKRSEDGRRFIKSQEITDEFLQSEAYSEMFIEFLTDAKAGAEFMEGIVPRGLVEEIRNTQAAKPVENVQLPGDALADKVDQSEPLPGSREYFVKKLEDPEWQPNREDLMKMDNDLIQIAFSRKSANPAG